ncbi:carnitine O-palmitoyltransferase 2, mitochondrial-like [Haliotis cracherodii]|uniref:carnitine O-palmitoyltransferase 2, mitochondrial-like n=1 Tax=Haliotis cracherodii TaxID=6455 RepID=UPI0039EA3701
MLRTIATRPLNGQCGQSLKKAATYEKSLKISSVGSKKLYSTASDEKEYLHRSVLPTYHFQKSLLRLGIPKLEKTCERYLKAQKPLLSPGEYSQTETTVQSFLQNEGQELHQELVANDKSNKHTSYISGPWFDMYLKDRSPLVLTHNPFVVFNNDPRPEYNDQLVRATNMIASSVRFMKTLKAEVLEPEVFHLNAAKSDTPQFRKFTRLLPQSVASYGAYWYKAFPLDMSQYGRLFNSTRIPRPERDELFTDNNARHLLVLRRGNFYTFDVLDQDGNIRPAVEIMANLKYILDEPSPQPEFPLGVLTSENRDVWTAVRSQLVDAGNEATLRHLDSAIFALVLDEEAPQDPDGVSRLFLHGDGINRWFDKSFQLILNSAGTAAVNFEHAWGDGVAVLRYFKEVFKDTTEKAQVGPDTKPANIDSSSDVKRLDFKLDAGIKQAIKEAKEKFDKKTSSLDLHHLEYKRYNKTFAKQHKVSPDAIMQLAIQLAYYRQNGSTVGTYESCSTAAFKHGRTETMRPCTSATQNMCQMLFESKEMPSVSDLQQGIRECSTVHQQLTKEAAMGQGFDRHMFAMRTLAESHGKVPDIFQDPAYKKINYNILSTSTLSDPAVLIGGFAPVVPDGYGIGYSIENNRIGFNITSYPPPRDVRDFIQCCSNSLDDIYDILEGNTPARKT